VKVLGQVTVVQEYGTTVDITHYTMSQKNCAKLFLSERRQISTCFDNF